MQDELEIIKKYTFHLNERQKEIASKLSAYINSLSTELIKDTLTENQDLGTKQTYEAIESAFAILLAFHSDIYKDI